MRPLVSLAALLLLAFSLTAAEIPISQPRVVAVETAGWFATAPSVASGDGFLVTWAERIMHGIYPGAIALRTYDDDGTPRQEVPVRLGNGFNPHAYWNGSEYVLVYANVFSRFGSSLPLPAIVTLRVRPDGAVLDGTTAVASARYGAGIRGIAWNGSEAVVLASLDGGQSLLRLDRYGNLVENTTLVAAATDVAARPDGSFFVLPTERGDAVAAGGSQFGVVDDQLNAVEGVILDSAGNELDRFTLSDQSSVRSSIAWDGSEWIAAFTRPGEVCTARFTFSTGEPAVCTPAPAASDPVLALGRSRIYKAWITDGVLMTDAGLASTRYTTAYNAAADVDATGLLAAWTESPSLTPRIVVGGLTDAGALRPETRIGGEEWQDWPRLASAGDRTLLTWIEGSDTLRATILDANATPLFEPKTIAPAFGRGAAVAARGDEWLVAWQATGGIESAIVTRAFDAVERQQFGSTAYQEMPAVAANAAGYLVAWIEQEQGAARLVVEPLDTRGRRYTGGNRVFETRDAGIGYPAIACGPQSCLIVTSYGSLGELWSTLVSHDGQRLAEDRVFATRASTTDLRVEPRADGSFRVWRSGTVTEISPTGEPGPLAVWTTSTPILGGVVSWRGRATAVYNRDGRVFASELVPRMRAVRR
ncbi:MAG TPA: hypothetical protein VEU30_01460 [Thermoanaerobaculia bacterium]|nr:hypothetical protein [Thermoanaerobaculia bacterium]